ncbi:MAG: hypothetical protein KME38_07085 [Spirirestis rafaelensis WJT71-NPBG6]|nr:hypothetical protein [Spirirestis rafaelensis WJT71-NPBG6]
MDDLPLLELFNRLREAGLPLGVNDYQTVLHSLQAGFGIADREALARLCRTLWVKSVDEERIFNHHFNQLIPEVIEANTSENFDSQELNNTVKRRKRAQIKFYLILGCISAFVIIAISIARKQVERITANLNYLLKLLSKSQPQTQPLKISIEIQNFLKIMEWLIIVFTIIILILAIIDFWKIQRQARHNVDETSLSPTPINLPKSTLSAEVIRRMNDEVQIAKAIIKSGKKSKDLHLISDYFPVTRRQMKQSWRYLRRLVREGPAIELDVEATVSQIGQQGILLNPVLVPRRVNRTELLLLIDDDGSMVPFHALAERLVETALKGGRLGKAGVYYFHNCPVDYLYRDRTHSQAESLKAVLEQLIKSRNVALIFSDAGAARGGLSAERIELTKDFLQQLHSSVRYVAWLNPVPRSRWATSSAGAIARFVPMFEVTRQGLDDAINALRGHHHNFTRK